MRLLCAMIFAGLCCLSTQAEDTAIDSSSPAAKSAELGKYEAKVYRAVGARWYEKINKMMQVVGVGQVKIQYTISYDGSVQIKVLIDSDQPIFCTICKNAIMEAAPFDPFPDALRKEVGNSFTDTFTFTVSPPDQGTQSKQGKQGNISQPD